VYQQVAVHHLLRVHATEGGSPPALENQSLVFLALIDLALG